MRVAAAERLTELLSHAVKTRSNGIRGQLAGKRDFVVAQAANFPHQKNITIDGAQAIEGFAKWFDMCRPPEATSAAFDMPLRRTSSAVRPAATQVARSR